MGILWLWPLWSFSLLPGCHDISSIASPQTLTGPKSRDPSGHRLKTMMSSVKTNLSLLKAGFLRYLSQQQKLVKMGSFCSFIAFHLRSGIRLFSLQEALVPFSRNSILDNNPGTMDIHCSPAAHCFCVTLCVTERQKVTSLQNYLQFKIKTTSFLLTHTTFTSVFPTPQQQSFY